MRAGQGDGFVKLSVIAAAGLAVLLWGASPVATKIAVSELPPVLVAILRTVFGGGLALAIVLSMRLPPPASAMQRLLLVLSAFCGFIGFPMLFSIGQHQTSAIHGAMILAFLPVMTGIVAMVFEKKIPGNVFWLGCLVALAGEAVLILTRQGLNGGQAGLIGDGVIFLSTTLASLGYVCGAKLQQSGYPSKGTTFWGAILASLAVLPVLPLYSGIPVLAVSLSGWLAIGYLAVGVTVVGYVLWYWALGQGGIAKVGLFQFFQPVTGVLLAAILLSEPLSGGVFLAALLILSGVWLALRAKAS
jgi:drug/metabolite transporter (DMT)-like permease